MKNDLFINQLNNSFSKYLVDISDEDAKNALIYGINCYKIEENESFKGTLFLSVNDENEICFSIPKNESIEALNIHNINKISYNVNEKDLKSHKPKSEDEKYFEIIINQTYFIFCVENFNVLLLLIKALIVIYNDNDEIHSESDKITTYKKSSDIESEINKIWYEFDKIFDHKEFKKFCEHSGILPSLMMINIDKNKDGLITKEELKTYLKDNMCGEIYKDYFQNIFS